MTYEQMERFELFLSESFGNDVYYRELRLSKDELEYLLKKYPNANVKDTSKGQTVGGKSWYEISLLDGGTKPQQAKEKTTVKA